MNIVKKVIQNYGHMLTSKVQQSYTKLFITSEYIYDQFDCCCCFFVVFFVCLFVFCFVLFLLFLFFCCFFFFVFFVVFFVFCFLHMLEETFSLEVAQIQ